MSDSSSVLILDDEAIVCQRLQAHLEKKAFEVETFTDSETALARLAERRFDVVVTDLKMKGPSGLDVLHFIKNHSPGTQVIIITGYASMEAVREAEYSGVVGFITKPFQLESMGNLVKKAAKQSRERGGRSEP